MKISVSIPIYDGKVPMHLALCLLTETFLATSMGHSLVVRFLPGCTNLAMGRNQLVKQFLESDEERLVFVDADVTFEPGDIIKLASYPVDFVGGVYRIKREQESYPVAYVNRELTLGAGLVEVGMVPTGFLSLSRKVFETFRNTHPGRDYMLSEHKTYAYFQIPFKDGFLYTEDAYFCKEWRELGGKIYMDPELTLTHWDGNIPFKGHIGNWLRQLAAQKETLNGPKENHLVLKAGCPGGIPIHGTAAEARA